MKHYATIIVPCRGNTCGNQYIPTAMSEKYYWSIWRVKARRSSVDGEIYLSDPVAIHWNWNQEETMRYCVSSAARGSFVCSEHIQNYSGCTESEFLGAIAHDPECAPLFSSNEPLADSLAGEAPHERHVDL